MEVLVGLQTGVEAQNQVVAGEGVVHHLAVEEEVVAECQHGQGEVEEVEEVEEHHQVGEEEVEVVVELQHLLEVVEVVLQLQ